MLVIENQSVRQMIRQAYGVWGLSNRRRTELARSTAVRHHRQSGRSRDARQLMAMLQTLLEDRFKLSFRRETRQLPIYALVQSTPGRFGSNLTVAKPEDAQGRLFPTRERNHSPICKKGFARASVLSNLNAPSICSPTILKDSIDRGSVRSWTFDVVNDEHVSQLANGLQLQPELLLHGGF